LTAALAGQPDAPAALRAMALAYMDRARAEPGLARKLDSLAQLPAEVMADDLVDTYVAGLATRRA
jgi:hypothetical protein